MSTLLLSLAAIVFVPGLLFLMRQPETCTLMHEGVAWKLEKAETTQAQTQGLMGRTSLCEKCGMLFKFETEKVLYFWMKDTLIPLDMYFYDAKGKLIDSALNMLPDGQTKDPMMVHSRNPAKYVIEVGQGSPFPADRVDIFTCQ